MGQFAILAALAALLIGGILVFNSQARTSEADGALRAYHTDQFAREAALVGLKQMERNLTDDIDEWDVWQTSPANARDTFQVPVTAFGDAGATFAVTLDSMAFGAASSDPDVAWVTAVGTFEGFDDAANATVTRRHVLAAVYETGMTDVGLPPAFRDAIVSEELIDMRGNIQISGGVHSNGALTSSGGSFDVFGTGTYTGSESANDAQFSGGVSYADSILIPTVAIPPAVWTADTSGAFALDPSNAPAATLVDGWWGVSGAGTAADPYVWYVNGDLEINGDVRLIGYSRLYVNGTVTVNGNAILAPVAGVTPDPNQDVTSTAITDWVSANIPDGSRIGIYATGDITLAGTCFVAAQLYTYGTVKYTGGGHKLLVGGMITWQPLDIRGNAKVYYTEATKTIEDPGINKDVPEGVRLIAYREWASRP